MQQNGPIVVELALAVSAQQAYDCFAGGFAGWWPVLTHSLSRDEGTRCRMEPVEGGAITETTPAGERHAWGRVLAAEPGRRLRFSWHPGREAESAQWVEVAFAPAPGGCVVTLTHGGWEALGEIGPILRQQYLPGWRHVLQECYAPATGTAPTGTAPTGAAPSR